STAVLVTNGSISTISSTFSRAFLTRSICDIELVEWPQNITAFKFTSWPMSLGSIKTPSYQRATVKPGFSIMVLSLKRETSQSYGTSQTFEKCVQALSPTP